LLRAIIVQSEEQRFLIDIDLYKHTKKYILNNYFRAERKAFFPFSYTSNLTYTGYWYYYYYHHHHRRRRHHLLYAGYLYLYSREKLCP